LNSVKEISKNIKAAKKQINDSKKYEKIINVPKIEKIKLSIRIYIITFLKYNRTCHKFC
jgi:hypothetical protein